MSLNTDMLHDALGEEASDYPSPGVWAATAAPFLLALTPADNVKALTIR